MSSSYDGLTYRSGPAFTTATTSRGLIGSHTRSRIWWICVLLCFPAIAALAAVGGALMLLFWIFEYIIPSQRHRILSQSFVVCRIVLGLQQHFVEVQGYRMAYMTNQSLDENKHLPIVVFLHGFTATKETWAFPCWMLRNTHRCIAIDFVGHGETTPYVAERYDIAAQVERVHILLTKVLGPNAKYHMCGTSMGGHAAGVYAAYHSSHVLSLGLLCCAGVEPPETSPQAKFVKEFIETGSCFFNVNSARELESFMAFASYRLCWIPRLSPGLMYADREWRDTYGPPGGLYRAMLRSIIYRHCELTELLKKIACPVQIQWGEYDRILDPSTIGVILHALSKSPYAHQNPLPDVVLYKGVGHCLQVETPWQCTRQYQRFLGTLPPHQHQHHSTSSSSSSASSSSSSHPHAHYHHLHPHNGATSRLKQ